MIQSKVTEKFMKFFATVRNQANVSTRELGELMGKSPMYISYIESGKTKTINFDTAVKMLVYINSKKQFISGRIDGNTDTTVLIMNMLIDTFGIEPEELIKQREKWEESEEQRELEKKEKLNEKIALMSTFLQPEDMELVNVMIKIAMMNRNDLDYKGISCLDDFISIIGKGKKRDLIFSVMGVISPSDYGVPIYIDIKTEKENRFMKRLEELLLEFQAIED